MLTINTNLNAQNAATQIKASQEGINTASERLTTGLRINKAADDVSGAALANRLETSSVRTGQYIKNAEDGINLLQTADSGLKSQQEVLTRMQELAFKAENGTNSVEDIGLINKEFAQLGAELHRNEASAEFNGVKLLDGTFTGAINVGEGTANQIGVTIAGGSAEKLAIVDAAGAMALDLTVGFADADAWKTGVHDVLDAYSQELNATRADIGAVQNRVEFASSTLESSLQNINSTLSSAQDTDFAAETTALAKEKVLSSASQAMLQQANKSQEDVTQLLR